MDAINKVMKARESIVEHTRGERNISGSIVCPVCHEKGRDGRLAFAVHHNGHIHAQCEEDGCVSWME